MKKSFITKMVNLMFAVLLCITMLPAGAFAAEGDPAPAAPAPATARSFTWYGHKLQFKSVDVIVDQPLDANSEPLNLKVKAKKKKTVIKWSSERAPGSVEGYILLRRKGKKGAFKEIAVLPAGSVKYVDKIKKKKKTAYTLVGFRRDTYGIHISPCSGEGRAPGRVYQNPSRYVQITDQIDKHGLGYYTAPVLVNSRSTREDHIDALIKTAYKYLGDRYVVCRSGAPGEGLDCSGLVMQACYGAGVDLWPSIRGDTD